MTTEAWLEANNEYLGASLEWLRLRLRSLAPEPVVPSTGGAATLVEPAPVAPPDPAPHPRRRWFASRESVTVEVLPPAPAPEPLPARRMPPFADVDAALDDRLRRAAEARVAASDIDPPPALVELARRFGLSPFERDTVLLCAAMDLDPALALLCARAQGDPARDHPTFALALSALEEPTWEALASYRPLRAARLVELHQAGIAPLTAAPLRADERVVNYLKGLNAVDERIAALAVPLDRAPGEELAPSLAEVAEQVLARVGDPAAGGARVVQLLGADGPSRIAVAQRVSASLDLRLYRIALDALPTSAADLDTFVRLWHRETVLLRVALLLDCGGREWDPGADPPPALQAVLGHDLGLVFLALRDGPLRDERAALAVEVGRPTPAEQRQAWHEALLADGVPADEAHAIARTLAGQFDLSVRDIGEAAAAGRAHCLAGCSRRDAFWDGARDLTRPGLDALAQRIEPKATWDDLVLATEHTSLMRQIAAQVRQRHTVYDEWCFSRTMSRGFGITALFTGESGTGKTMAAEVIANELRLTLYRIDLSAVISKYIGETEKNLRRLFDAAERGGAILFFDEADALFGKRSEVKDSHDRYANIEINYLLQRMEAFRGLAILATNMKSALDPAFMRRLRFVVHFPFPAAKERALIWRKALPPEVPKGELDYERLAKLSLTGGNIHAIALGAAFQAAEAGGRVTMDRVLAAARMELRKLERPVTAAEVR